MMECVDIFTEKKRNSAGSQHLIKHPKATKTSSNVSFSVHALKKYGFRKGCDTTVPMQLVLICSIKVPLLRGNSGTSSSCREVACIQICGESSPLKMTVWHTNVCDWFELRRSVLF
ncbi:hypothetical protein FQA47_017697 [Oryzias melastigma]|uniref:Uncharacterized protein n=1 Tax=Oryzias melastigma TaxID=30732 RepID=A0A834FQZ1_ORYME|nr:hypothetical protein FQA47_017697 [Oryzias melastigma]